MKAKNVAACEAAKEVVSLKKVLANLEVILNLDNPLTLFCDNSRVVANSKEPRSHKRSKHTNHKYPIIREFVQRRDVSILKIASKNNLDDPFMKALPARVFEGHMEGLGLKDMSHLL